MSLSTAWRDAQLRHLVSEPIQNGLGEAAAEGDPSWPRYIRITDIVSMTQLDPDKVETLAPEIAGKAPVRRGDLLCAAVGASVGTSYLHESDEAACYAGYLVRIRPDLKNLEPRFLGYWAQSAEYWQQIRAGSIGSTIENFSASRYRSMRLSIPEVREQRRIAEFLDRETAQIDELIAKQTQLISTLAERETGLIFDQVTRGLDESVPMSESSLWFERRPSHWLYGNIRHFAAMKTGHTPSRSVPEYWENCDIPWFTLADVWQLRQGNRYLGATENQISELGLANSAAELLPTGTVVLSRTASVGFTGIMPKPMATSQDFWNWVCRTDRLLPEFLWYQFRAMNPYIRSLMYGSTHKTIYQADASSFQIVVPPIDEQRAIVDSLDELTDDASRAVLAAQRMIDLLRERRQALISAAVTGQIDVGGAS